MSFIKTDQIGFERDISSKAVSITNDSAREEHRHKIKTRKELDELRQKVVYLEHCCEVGKQEIEVIKMNYNALEEVRTELAELKSQITGNK